MQYAKLTKLSPRKELIRETFATFDCETRDGLRGCQLFCYVFAFAQPKHKKFTKNWIKTIVSDDLSKLFSWFEERIENVEHPSVLTIYVHNLGFDVRFIEDYCIKNRIVRQPILSGSRMVAYIIDSLKIRFVDSLQFLFSSQEKAEILWKVPEELRKIDCKSIFNRPYDTWTDKDKSQVRQHCRNDGIALYYIMERFRQTMFDLCGVDVISKLTLSSFSMNAFRITMERDIINPFLYFKSVDGKPSYRIDKEKESFCRRTYYGGRTEVFDLNAHRDVSYVDVVSLYPSVMYEHQFPVGIPYWVHGHDKIERELNNGKICFIKCKYAPPNIHYPVLPSKYDGKLCFSVEPNIGYYTSAEIEYALDVGYQIEFLTALVFPEKQYLFRDYIGKFSEIKKNSSGGKRMAAKISMNSLSGKFGQALSRQEFVSKFFDTEDEVMEFVDDAKLVKYSKHYERWQVVFLADREVKHPYQIVSIASYILSLARVVLIKFIHQLERMGIMTIYCDTDSVVIPNSDLSKIKLGKDLGNWDIEHKFDYFRAFAPKAYVYVLEDGHWWVKLKGAPRDALRDIISTSRSIDEIEYRIRGTLSEIERYDTYRNSLRHGMALRTRKLTKHYSFDYQKRRVLPNLTTKPWSREDERKTTKEIEIY